MHKPSSFRLVDRVSAPQKKSAAGAADRSGLPNKSSVASGRASMLPENTHALNGGSAKQRRILAVAKALGSVFPASTPANKGALVRHPNKSIAALGNLSALPV